ncbi:MAG: TIM barrel protein [Bacillota bacterium]|nr:TIM barrel protein [Bacillota bacterium]
MGISIQMYTLRDFIKTQDMLRETLARVARIGYRTVQISVPTWLTVETLKVMLDDAGLAADSVMAPTATVQDRIDEICRTASILQTDAVRTDGIPRHYSETAEGFSQYARILQSAGSLLRKHGLHFMYHNHAIEYTNFPVCTGMDILLRETDPDCVWFQPDVHHIAAAGLEPSQALYDFAGRCAYVHMQGYGIVPGEGLDPQVPRRTVPVGSGNLNWSGIVNTCQIIGVRLYVVEQDFCMGDPFAEIAQSYRAMQILGIQD